MSTRQRSIREYYVYILANSRHKLYVGVTNDLARRDYEHKHKLTKGFASKYNMDILAYYESTVDVDSAIAREKQLKGWLRKRKVDLIESVNPRWVDLSRGWYG